MNNPGGQLDNIDLADLCGGLEDTKTFSRSPLALQQELRDEWHGGEYEANATSKPLFSRQQMKAALAAAPEGDALGKDAWAKAIATHGGGVKATLAEMHDVSKMHSSA